MTTLTYDQLTQRHSVPLPSHLESQADIPVGTGPQRQGDIIVLPERPSADDLGDAVPAQGIAVVRGEAGGNTHLLVADGSVGWKVFVDAAEQDLGTLTVAAGATAYLLHPEHGAQGIGVGTYLIRRQREQRDRISLVAD